RTINHTGGGNRKSVSPDSTPIRDLPPGITRSDSSRWQKLAAIPEPAWERFLQNSRDTGTEITTQAALRLAKSLARSDHHRALPAPPQTARTLSQLIEAGK